MIFNIKDLFKKYKNFFIFLILFSSVFFSVSTNAMSASDMGLTEEELEMIMNEAKTFLKDYQSWPDEKKSEISDQIGIPIEELDNLVSQLDEDFKAMEEAKDSYDENFENKNIEKKIKSDEEKTKNLNNKKILSDILGDLKKSIQILNLLFKKISNENLKIEFIKNFPNGLYNLNISIYYLNLIKKYNEKEIEKEDIRLINENLIKLDELLKDVFKIENLIETIIINNDIPDDIYFKYNLKPGLSENEIKEILDNKVSQKKEKLKDLNLKLKREKNYEIKKALTVEINGLEFEITELENKKDSIQIELESTKNAILNQEKQIKINFDNIREISSKLSTSLLLIVKESQNYLEKILPQDYEIAKERNKKIQESLAQEERILKQKGENAPRTIEELKTSRNNYNKRSNENDYGSNDYGYGDNYNDYDFGNNDINYENSENTNNGENESEKGKILAPRNNTSPNRPGSSGGSSSAGSAEREKRQKKEDGEQYRKNKKSKDNDFDDMSNAIRSSLKVKNLISNIQYYELSDDLTEKIKEDYLTQKNANPEKNLNIDDFKNNAELENNISKNRVTLINEFIAKINIDFTKNINEFIFDIKSSDICKKAADDYEKILADAKIKNEQPPKDNDILRKEYCNDANSKIAYAIEDFYNILSSTKKILDEKIVDNKSNKIVLNVIQNFKPSFDLMMDDLELQIIKIYNLIAENEEADITDFKWIENLIKRRNKEKKEREAQEEKEKVKPDNEVKI